MHEKAGKVIPIVVESIKDTDSNVVNPPCHGTVHGFRVISIVMLGSMGMQDFVIFSDGRFPGRGYRCQCLLL